MRIVTSRAAIELFDEVRRCRLCTNLPGGPRPVLQIGPEARILLASQAPGGRAHASGVPFDDPSGARLRRWLGVTDAEFFDPALFAIVPMGLCYPGTGEHGDNAPVPLCARTWRVKIIGQLPRLNLTLAIGRHAIAWHFPDKAATVADAIMRSRDDLFALPHPSPRNNRWLAAHRWFENDILPQLRGRIRALIETRHQ